jgi:transcriptional regulator with XRE-family HTH domain
VTAEAERAAAIDAQVGARLRDARLQAVLTQDELAHALGVDRSTVAKWEAGQRSMTVANLVRAAAILDIQPQQLLAAPAASRPAARELSDVIVQQQAVQTIARTLEQRPDAIATVMAALQRWAQNGQPSAEARNPSGGAEQAIVHRLHGLDLAAITPLRALQVLDELQRLAAQPEPEAL